MCMGRAKTAIEFITKSCTDKKLQGWRSIYIDKFMQVSFQYMHLFQEMVGIGLVIIHILRVTYHNYIYVLETKLCIL